MKFLITLRKIKSSPQESTHFRPPDHRVCVSEWEVSVCARASACVCARVSVYVIMLCFTVSLGRVPFYKYPSCVFGDS